MYLIETDSFYNQKTIMAYEFKGNRIELVETNNDIYSIIQENQNERKVSNFDDLSIALNIYHSLIETKIDLNLH